LNLEGTTWKAKALMIELPLLYGLDVITKPISHETSHETFGLLDFLILGATDIRTPRFPDIRSPTFGLLDTSKTKSNI